VLLDDNDHNVDIEQVDSSCSPPLIKNFLKKGYIFSKKRGYRVFLAEKPAKNTLTMNNEKIQKVILIVPECQLNG